MGEVPEKAKNAVGRLYEHLNYAKEKWVPKYKKRKYYAKPWWSQECSKLCHEREKLYRRFKQTGQLGDQIAWKRARALTKRKFKEAKRESWRNCVSNLQRSTNSSEV